MRVVHHQQAVSLLRLVAASFIGAVVGSSLVAAILLRALGLI